MDFDLLDIKTKIETDEESLEKNMKKTPTYKKLDCRSINVNGVRYNVRIYTSIFDEDKIIVSLERTPKKERWDIYSTDTWFWTWKTQRRKALKVAKEIEKQIRKEIEENG